MADSPDPVAAAALDLARELAPEALARVRGRLRAWQDALEAEWASLPARLAASPRGRSTLFMLERWLEERESAARASAAATAEDRALVRLEQATLEGLRARLRAEGEPAGGETAEDDGLARYVLALEGREAPLGNLAALVELWGSLVDRAARADARVSRHAEPRVRRGPGPGELSLVFEGPPALVAELRAVLGRLGASEG